MVNIMHGSRLLSHATLRVERRTTPFFLYPFISKERKY